MVPTDFDRQIAVLQARGGRSGHWLRRVSLSVLVFGCLMPQALGQDPPPWQQSWEVADELPTFASVCFGDFDPRALTQPDDLKKWFAPVPGQRFDVRPAQIEAGHCAELEGLAKLQMPWRPEVAWRLSLQRFSHLRLHLFHGVQGVTLAYHEEEQDGWAAYITTRKPGAPQPESYVLTATDEGRARRTELRRGGTFEVRWHAQELLLSRGDIVLLRAPCEQVPEAVYLEGKAAVCGIAAVRSQPPPNDDRGGQSPDQGPVETASVLDSARPGELEWTPKLGPGAQFTMAPDGTVQLSADKAERSGSVITLLPKSGGVYEVIVEVDQATPGTGVFLGRGEGLPTEAIRFVRDRRSGRTCLTVRDDDTTYEHDFPPVADHTVAFAAEHQWIRLIFGCGAVRWWISPDGVHWAIPEAPWGSRSGNVTSFGVQHVPKLDGCRIRLRRVTVRELPLLTSLAPRLLLERAKSLIDAAHIGLWVARATESLPADVDLDEWRRACAVRTLGAGCARELANSLVGMLWEDTVQRGWPVEQQRALLKELALLLDTRDDVTCAETLLQRYHQLGLRAFEQQGERPFSWIRQAAMSVPLATAHQVRLFREDTVRLELMQLAEQQRWAELHDFCRQLRFFRSQEGLGLLPWAEAIAVRNQWRRETRGAVAGLHEDWRHPWTPDVSRETYNVLTELRSALDGGSLDEAARFIAAVEPGLTSGLTPSLDDRQLLVSLPTALRLALDTRPELAARIRERFGPAALLRVQQAARDSNAAVVQLATIQYAGSEAAAEAHRWLGDRALSSGWFLAAVAQYRQAARSASAASKRDLAPRVRLAAAMVGRQVGRPTSMDVKLGGVGVRAEAFESLLAEMLKQNSAEPTTARAFDTSLPTAPQPTGFNIVPRGQLDGAVGRDPATELVPNARRFNVDWVGRQLATAVEGNTLYVSNRFQVAAYDLTSGQRKWQGQLAQDGVLRAQDWGLVRMRPLITPQCVFVRLLYQPTAQLVCLDKRTGETRWTSEPVANRHFVSDPLWIQGQLVALTLSQLEPDENQLRLAILDAESGRVIRQHDLLRLNEVWARRRYCEVTPLDDGLAVAVAGLTFCCDVDGTLRWLRRHTLLPPNEELQWVTQDFNRPLAAGNALYVTQPGLRSVQRLATDTGRSIWSVVLPTSRGIVGLAAGRVIVQLDDGLLALDGETGKKLWTHPAAELLTALLTADDGILYSRRVALEDGKPGFQPQLAWLDPNTGLARAVTRLNIPGDPDPRLGPLVVAQGRLWTFLGRGHDQTTRELIELVPQGPAQKPEPDLGSIDPWTGHLPQRLVAAMVQKLGPWRLVCGEPVGPQAVETERWGRRDVPGTRCRSGLPIILTRRISIPQEGQTKLRLSVGNEPGQEWKLQVRLGEQDVFSKEVTATADPQPWKTLEVDLTGQAGQSGWLTIEAHFLRNGDHADLFWDTLELVSR
ncbi:MAG: PQQ-binding-like beta-propeller repeat protein [Planctomycetota bacterium]|nr:PQQ-binding-like beta-propeller repeat protein [Planctomycetota bacterium]